MTDPIFLTATELGPLIESKQISPVELTEQFLDRIKGIDGIMNTYITVMNDEALKHAREAEKDIMNNQYKGPLHGIPISIKDNYETKGIRSTAGSKIFEDHIPEETAITVEKMLEAGAIPLGKLNMNPLGMGSSGINGTFGASKNPWNTEYITGGSSSGSAAALAAGLTTLTTGTDTWGSNRVPPAMSGVYGLKTTYGLVSSHGLIPTVWSLDRGGPITRSVSDLGLMLNYMAGYDSKDPASLNVALPDYTSNLDKGIKGTKIGVPSYYREGLDKDVEKLFNEAISKLKSLGAEIKEIEIPELSLSAFAGLATIGSEAATYNTDILQSHPQDYAQDVRVLLAFGKTLSATDYLEGQQARRELSAAFQEAFEEVDIFLGPTVPITTPKIKENWVEQNIEVIERCLPFTVPANLTGVPSLSVPMGLDSNGLPTGMQFIGPRLSEKQLLQAAKAWETTEPIIYGNEN